MSRRVFQGPSYSCGFASLPTFGKAAAAWTWHFDFQQQYIGAGMLVPHVVAWSMMLGAVLSWGLMWPLLAVRQLEFHSIALGFWLRYLVCGCWGVLAASMMLCALLTWGVMWPLPALMQ